MLYGSGGEIVDSAHSLIGCGYGYGSPAPCINGRSEAPSYVVVQPRVLGDKGLTGGEWPKGFNMDPPSTWDGIQTSRLSSEEL
jgi:hypothetical protein